MHPLNLRRLFTIKGENPVTVHLHYGKGQEELLNFLRKVEGLGCDVLAIMTFMDGESSCAKLVVDLKGLMVREFEEKLNVNFELFEIRLPLIKGLMADVFTFPIEDDDRRFILASMEALKGIKKHMEMNFGPVVSTMMFYAGMEVGREACREYYCKLRRFELKDAVVVLCGALTALGYAKASPTFDDRFDDRCLITLYDSWECELERPARTPRSNFIRGLIKGSLEEALGKEVEVREISCIAKGDDGCTFSIKVKPSHPA